nr:hypothetical protein [Rhodoferax sp.]
MQGLAKGAPSPFRLGKGQSVVLQLTRGTVLRVSSGAVTLVQRIALDHAQLLVQTPVSRGGVHRVEVSGWVEMVAAQGDAELLVLVPQAISLVQGLRGWLDWAGGLRKPDHVGARLKEVFGGSWM